MTTIHIPDYPAVIVVWQDATFFYRQGLDEQALKSVGDIGWLIAQTEHTLTLCFMMPLDDDEQDYTYHVIPKADVHAIFPLTVRKAQRPARYFGDHAVEREKGEGD